MPKSIANDSQLPRLAMQTNDVSVEQLRGRAAGIIVCTVMGLAWTGPALLALSPVAAVPILVVSVAICAALLVGARRLQVAVASAHSAAYRSSELPSEADMQNVRRRFVLVTVGEFAAIVAAGNILAWLGSSRWIPAVICAVVGLHFVPLARLFRVRLYYGTAGALCLVAATTMAFGVIGSSASLWKILPGLGAAVVLWATGALLLVEVRRPS